jgi:sec-independent protein translocase protein TatA
MRLGMGEILVILVIALLVFGPSKLPQLGDALGKGIRNFKKAFETPDPEEKPSVQGESSRLAAGGHSAAPSTGVAPPEAVDSKRG